MRSKRLHVLVMCLLLSGSMLALTPTAQAYDPQAEKCKGQVGIMGINIKVSPITEGMASSLNGEALLCGTDINDEGLWDKSKGFLTVTIKLPITLMGKGGGFVPGIVTRCANPKFKDDPSHVADCGGTADLKEGHYIGSVGMGITTVTGFALDGLLTTIYVQKAPDYPDNSDCDAKAIACYQGIIGEGWPNFYSDMVVRKKSRQYQLEIGKIKGYTPSFKGAKIYITRIGYPEQGNQLDLCAYAGPINGTECGNHASGDWVQKNGPAAVNSCDALQWLFWPLLDKEGKEGETLGGYGFSVEAESEVEGASDWWGNDPRLNEEDWMDKYPDLVDEIVAAGGINSFCVPLKIIKAEQREREATKTPPASRSRQATSPAKAQPKRKALKRKVKKHKHKRSKTKRHKR